jgi:gamma-glutamyltranspeptidase/glutathione hydrolase
MMKIRSEVPVNGVWMVVRALALLAAWTFAPGGSAQAAQAAIASPDRYGADVAGEILGAGGNAADAAVAVAFALAVTYPEAGNIGGGGFATLRIGGRSYFLDYRERAPQRATAGMYLDDAGRVIPDASTVGAAAAGVPGTVMGMWELHKRFGKLAWARDLAPAVRLAREGYVVSGLQAERAATTRHDLGGRTNFASYFDLRAGERLLQPELAATLARIAKGGAAEFYRGRTARLVVAEMRRSHGLLDARDFAAYRAVWREPLVVQWAGYDVVTAPPPSSGGIALVQLLKMREHSAARFDGVALNSPQYVHLIAELEKRAFADRAEYLGDPDHWRVPVERLVDDGYLAERARGIDADLPSPTPSVLPGLGEHHQTTHFSVVDRFGNAVSNTYTLNDSFGNGQVVRGAGFLLNNEMDDFSVKPGTPNLYGVIGGDANAIAPGKRPLSSMSPTILTRDGRVVMAIGTPGGSRIFTSVFQVLCNWHDFGMSLTDAVAAVRVHHQLLPSQVIFEEPWRQLDEATVVALKARGYLFERQDYEGDIQAILVGADRSEAVADPRAVGVGRVFN